MFPTKRPNFRRISHSWMFSPKRPNFHRISHSLRFRQNGRMNPDEFTQNFVLGDVSDETAESAEFRIRGHFPINGRISAEFCSQGRFRQNRRINPAEFRTWDDSDEKAKFMPNFALMDVSPETIESIPPNFALGTFPPKQPNQSRRISAEFRTWGRFRRNSRTFTKFRPRGRFPRNGRISAEFRTRGCFPLNGRISAQFRTRGRFRRNGRINPAEFPQNFTLADVSNKLYQLL
ncbi:MAG: hypothetical protein Q8881_04055 [Sweet potato little leaf phytoplasma]|nr:hypothetical protein [Sweet potato little leaf phytoplasma]